MFDIAVLELKVKQVNTTQDYKSSELKINLNQLSVVDKINLYKQTCKIIFLDLIQSTVNIRKLKTQLIKVERHLMQEMIENKDWQLRIA